MCTNTIEIKTSGPLPETDVNSCNEQTKSQLAKSTRWSRCSAAILGCLVVVAAIFGVLLYVSGGDLLYRSKGALNGAGGNTVVTMATVAEHNAPEVDCWLVMYGNAYDLTNYKHPGGQGWISNSCGEDATVEYSREHKESLLGTVSQYLVGPVGTVAEAAASAEAATATSIGGTGNLRPSSQASASEATLLDSSSGDFGAVAAQPASTNNGNICIATQDISSHSSREDCWYILYGNVYDFTDYIDRHPGGADVVFRECGTDATSSYSAEKKHDESLLSRKAAGYILGEVC